MTMTGWLRRWRLLRAAERYARQLGSHLARAYGPSEFYSVGQIRAATAKLGLNPRYIAFGFAGFLPEEAYAAAVSQMPIPISYCEARELFERFRPSTVFSASSNPETSIPIIGVGYKDH